MRKKLVPSTVSAGSGQEGSTVWNTWTLGSRNLGLRVGWQTPMETLSPVAH